MGEVVSLAQHREENSPHGAGQCVCVKCKHEWTGVAPVGIAAFECPACREPTSGRWKKPFLSSAGQRYIACNSCDGELMFGVMDEVDKAVILCCGICGSRISSVTLHD